MSPERQERRRYQRLKSKRPLPALIGEKKGFLVDIAVNGALLVHRDQLPLDQEYLLDFEWDGHALKFRCRIVRTELQRTRTTDGMRMVHYSGIEFTRALGDSDAALRKIILQYVERALDEQKANARGIPAFTPISYQAGGRNRGYLRYRFRQGQWERSETPDADQPSDGFTISAEESPEQIEILCQSYAESDFTGRQLIRKMAALSISSSEGVPTRRYDP
ncbi:MAG TPA: PilZ domain-containing protein [Thermoanaerobaculia bacterium]|nr:PilZ domain-containing protein [Thermoanaerobaculia bacterium]